MTSNLPPGVTDSMIPGNSPEDVAWERFLDQIYADASALRIDSADAECAWKIGLAAYAKARGLACKFPHDSDYGKLPCVNP